MASDHFFDLNLLEEFCEEQGLPSERQDENAVDVQLRPHLTLCFQNVPKERDTDIYFRESTGGWHSHGDLWEQTVELVPLTVLGELLAGRMLVVEYRFRNGVVDISVSEIERCDDHRSMDPGESVTYHHLGTLPTS